MSSLSSDIILIGAGRHPATKQLRQQNGFPRRNFWIGEINVRTGLRIPVNIAFVQKYYDEIARRISDGTLLVEYKMDKFVDLDELKTLAYGSDAEKEAYEEEIAGGVKKQAEAMEAAKSEYADSTRQAEYLQRDGDEEARRVDPTGLLPPGGGAAAAASALSYEGKQQFAKDAGIDVEALSKSPEQAPAELAEQPQFAGDIAQDEMGGDGKVKEDAPNNDVPSNEDESEYVPTSNEAAPSDNPDFKPLPKDWQHSNKPELLSLCAERGIDTSDMPSNKVLKQRLDKYAAGGG